MKELTIEEKAQAYDEAIERANELLYVSDKESLQCKTIKHILPVLKESEDKNIRKYIISSLNALLYTKGSQADKERNDAIAWLEKQGEPINLPQFTFDDVLALQCVMEIVKGAQEDKELYEQLRSLHDRLHDAYWLEKQGKQKLVEKYNIRSISSKNAQGKLGEMIKEMKSADKIEPKFKVGDWITDGNITIQIETIENNCYLYYGDCALYSTKTADKVYHLWTIEDAKDGDVLAVEPIDNHPSPFIAIYKERGLDYFNSYCFIGFDAKFYTGDTGHDMTGIHPATKEQRDILFQKMHKAGYEWNAEKKELKKIENKNPLLSDFFKAEYERGKADAQKPAWSKEDETTKNNISHIIRQYDKISKRENQPCYYVGDCLLWMQNIKGRVLPQPKQEWREEDKEMLNLIIARLHSHPNLDLEEYGKEYDWLNYNLKSLRPQKQWKPSEELITYLYEAIDIIEEQEKYSIVTALRELLEQLKQL